jgi:FemAB-related protein (PEP-CTERM system-associated)
MHLTLADDSDREHWDDFVHRHRVPSHSHLFAWGRVLARAYGLRWWPFLALRQGRVAGVLPVVTMRGLRGERFFISLPFVNSGGPLAEDAGTESMLMQRALAWADASGVRYGELRCNTCADSELPVRHHKVRSLLPLPESEDKLWGSFSAKVRNQVRKARRSDLWVRAGGADELDGFYGVYSRRMHDLGVPAHSKRFFREVLRAFEQHYRVFVVLCRNEPVGAALCCTFRDRVEVPWACSLRSAFPRCPNHLLYYEMMRASVEKGASMFDFGRSTEGEGTYRFKEQWGSQPVRLQGYWWSANAGTSRFPGLDPRSKWLRALSSGWRRMPLGVVNRLGPWLIRRLPG